MRSHRERCVGVVLSLPAICIPSLFSTLILGRVRARGESHYRGSIALYVCVCACVCVCGLPVFNYSCHLKNCGTAIVEKVVGNQQEATGCCLFFLPRRLLKAVFQGDGLEIVRLNLSLGGWELPSGRNAKGCLEAVKATAGEYSFKKAKKKRFLLTMICFLLFLVFVLICRCSLL